MNRKWLVWAYVLAVTIAAECAYPILVGEYYGPYTKSDFAAALLLLAATPAAESLVVHIHFRKSAHSFSLLELPLTAGILTMPPLLVVAAYGLGSGIVLLAHRKQPPVKLIFNTATFVLTATIAEWLFHLLPHHASLLSPVTWAAVGASVLVASLVGMLLVVGAISLAERRFDSRAFLSTCLWGLSTACGGISLGIAVSILASESLISVIFITAPLLALFTANRAYESERQRRQSLQMVFDTSRTLTEEAESETAIFGVLTRCHLSMASDFAVIYLQQGPNEFVKLLVDESGQHRSIVSQPVVQPLLDRVSRRRGAWAVYAESSRAPAGSTPEAQSDELAALRSVTGRPEISEALLAPLREGTNALGVVVVASCGAAFRHLGDSELELFETVCRAISSHTQLSREAYEDPLTGLPNRRRLVQRLEAAFNDGTCAQDALLLIDLDDFKGINDTFGHAVGDGVLCEVGRRMQHILLDGWVAARLGGDEFALMGPVGPGGDYMHIGELALGVFTEPIEVADQSFQVRASIGLGLGVDAASPAALLRNADTALYAAKGLEKGRLMVFNQPMHERAARRYLIGEALRQALSSDEIYLAFQPVVSLESGAVVGAEVLARWEHPDFGTVSPTEFVQIAEEQFLSARLATRILTALVEGARILPGKLSISMNVSPGDLGDESFVAGLLSAANAIRPHILGVELTERTLLANHEVGGVLRTLRRAGLEVYIDDFGTGYSSLAYLKDLPADYLKIPREFVGDLENSERTRAVVRGVVALGQALGLTVLAEGVETVNQQRLITEAGAEFAQGYLFDRPLSLRKFRERAARANGQTATGGVLRAS